jgi:hypothetical protein
LTITFKKALAVMKRVDYIKAKNEILKAEIESGYKYVEGDGLTYIQSNELMCQEDLNGRKYMLECNVEYLKTLEPKETEDIEEYCDDPLPF